MQLFRLSLISYKSIRTCSDSLSIFVLLGLIMYGVLIVLSRVDKEEG